MPKNTHTGESQNAKPLKTKGLHSRWTGAHGGQAFFAYSIARDLDRGDRISIECTYLVGCDGASSMVRKAIGAKYAGTPVLQYAQSWHIRAPALLNLLPGKRAWLYGIFYRH